MSAGHELIRVDENHVLIARNVAGVNVWTEVGPSGRWWSVEAELVGGGLSTLLQRQVEGRWDPAENGRDYWPWATWVDDPVSATAAEAEVRDLAARVTAETEAAWSS